MPRFTPDDEQFLRRALTLAARGQGAVEPNPMVGCVLVRRGRVIGEGYHHRFGGPHAEVDALRHCTAAPRGATAYVTLEPCNHYGKTPPCTDALLVAGIARVVAPLNDPNSLVAGRGFQRLRRAGVRVDVGLLHDAAAALIAPYVKLVTTHRPWVILKWAQSLDGKVATRTGDSKWITDETCRAHAHRTRGRVDAVIVGVGTVVSDDPLLTCRAGRPRRDATRVVLDASLRAPPRCQLVRTAREHPTWIFCGPQAPATRARTLEKAGCVIARVPLAQRGGPRAAARLSLTAVLDRLGAQRMTNVLVEGGARVLGAFFDAQLADEYHVYVAPLLIGGTAAPGALSGDGAATMRTAIRLPAEAHPMRLGAGYFVAARVGAAGLCPGR